MTISLQLSEGSSKTLYFAGKTFSYKDLIRAIPGSAWERSAKRWEIPLESTEDALRIMPSLEIAPAVKQVFKDLKDRQQKAVAVKSIDEKKVSGKIKGLKGELYPYQAVGKAFLDTLEDGEGAILAFDMGLGKSLTGLASFVDWKNKGLVDYLLVVCPSPLKYSTWEKEVKKWTSLEYVVIDGDKRETVEWEDGTKEKLTGAKLREVQYQQYEYGADVTIMNYELFLRDMDIIPPVDGRWLVILDEAHRIKNPKAQTTKNLIKKLKPAGRKILGTGTPLENNIQELWTLTDFCRPGILGTYYKFLDRYVEMDFFGKPVAPKPQMISELTKRLEPIMLRKSKADALPDLPPLSVVNYSVKMTKEQQRLYKQVKDGILEIAKEQGSEFSYLEALAQITRLQQVCDSPALLRKVMENSNLPEESGKMNALGDIIVDLDPHRHKFILFSQYKEMTDILYTWLTSNEKLGLRKEQIGYIKGGLKATETGRIQNEFQNGDIQCVLMTTAGNYGLDLSMGSYVICYDQLFNPQKMEQIYARAHRNGVKSAVTAINMITEGSYEEKKLEILENKRELFKAIVDEDEVVMKKLFSSPQDLLDLI
jgi:SNF2 family DNA or RNA helicase